ncbi:MAG: YbaN family protein [Sphaerochaeta sp.]|nr:YbaN family protein [Sphaerochaeta sp.]
MVRNKVLRLILAFFGIISVVLGGIGVFLPVLPTTPFVLLAGLLFSFSSERLGNWLEQNRILGPYLKHYRKGTGIPKKAKVKALITLWIGMGITFYLVGKLPLIIMLATIATIVSIHIITIKPKHVEVAN